jgi:hypothetical protein
MSPKLTMLNLSPPPVLATWRNRSLLLGVVFGIAAIIGFVMEPAQALQSYLSSYMLILGLSLGSMAWLMVWHLTGGAWGVPIRRILEAAMLTLPVCIVGWIPIAVGVHTLYDWSHPEVRALEKQAHEAVQWLSVPAWLFRGVLYFAIWVVLAWLLMQVSRDQDQPPERAFGAKLRGLSGVGIIIYAWTVSFAVVDWVMSLTPQFASTIYGLIFLVGQGLVAMCLVVMVGHALRAYEPIRDVVRPDNFHDYGKLMLTFVMLWAYFSFSQWLITWSGNLPDEISWFIERIHGEWGYVGFALILGHFCIPFCLLLSRGLKRNSGRLIWVAAWLFLMRYIDIYWNVEPAFHRAQFHWSWLDAVMPIALVALWLAYFFWQLGRRPMLAQYDPHVPAYLEAAHE